MFANAPQHIDRVAQSVGYAGAGTFFGLALTEVELLIRIGVGALTIISLCIHIYLKLKNANKKDD